MFDLSLPGATLSTAYPELPPEHPGVLDRIANRAVGPMVRSAKAWRVRRTGIPALVAKHASHMEQLSSNALRATAGELRQELRDSDLAAPAVARSFALIRETAGRTIGMRHFDCQLVGGWILLNGLVAEMETGEGKTLTATLPACTAALAGVPVHVITVNDYLVVRDAEITRPLYEALGLTVGVVTEKQTPPERQAAYACNVTYGTNKTIVFDYLRDRITLASRNSSLRLQLEKLGGDGSRVRRLLLRGLNFAIIDEADSVLVDEARTPLIISAPAESGDEERVALQG